MPAPAAACECLSRSASETIRIGERLGGLIQAPVVIALTGGLGSGKTAFVQGLARGLGVPPGSAVASPTFALVHHHPGRLPLCHIDLYRLEAPVEIEALGLEELLDGPYVCAVEWADRLPAWALGERLALALSAAGENHRRMAWTAYGQGAAGLLKALGSFFPGQSACDPTEGAWD